MDYYKNRKIDFTKPVEVYRNLRSKRYLYSIRQDRLVRAHTDDLTLINCIFKVIESGRQRVISSGQKNVHAYVKGYVHYDVLPQVKMSRISYNPYEQISFTTDDGTHVVNSKLVVCCNTGVYVQIV